MQIEKFIFMITIINGEDYIYDNTKFNYYVAGNGRCVFLFVFTYLFYEFIASMYTEIKNKFKQGGGRNCRCTQSEGRII